MIDAFEFAPPKEMIVSPPATVRVAFAPSVPNYDDPLIDALRSALPPPGPVELEPPPQAIASIEPAARSSLKRGLICLGAQGVGAGRDVASIGREARWASDLLCANSR